MAASLASLCWDGGSKDHCQPDYIINEDEHICEGFHGVSEAYVQRVGWF